MLDSNPSALIGAGQYFLPCQTTKESKTFMLLWNLKIPSLTSAVTPMETASAPKVTPFDSISLFKSISNNVIIDEGVRLASSKFKDLIEDRALTLSGV